MVGPGSKLRQKRKEEKRSVEQAVVAHEKKRDPRLPGRQKKLGKGTPQIEMPYKINKMTLLAFSAGLGGDILCLVFVLL